MASSCHLISEWWRLEGTSGVHLVQPCSQAGQSQLPRTLARWLWKSQRRKISQAPWQSVSHTPPTQKVFPNLQRETPVLQCMPMAWPLVLTMGTTGKSLALSDLLPPLRFWIHYYKIPCSLLFPRLNRPSSPSLSS